MSEITFRRVESVDFKCDSTCLEFGVAVVGYSALAAEVMVVRGDELVKGHLKKKTDCRPQPQR